MNKKSGSSLGILIILIGITVLLMNFDILSLDMFWGISKLWPLIFIVIGLSILFKSIKYISTILWLVFIGLVIAYSFINLEDKSWSIGGDVSHSSYQSQVASFEEGHLKLKINTGEASIDVGQAGQVLYSIPDDYVKPVEINESEAGLFLAFEEEGKNSLSFSKNNKFDITLPDQGQWYLDIDTGVGAAKIDLEGLTTSGMLLDVGLGECHVTLDESARGLYKVDSGIGEVVFNLPEGLGVKVIVDKGIGSVKVPDTYDKRSGSYVSSNYETAENTIEIEVELGIGSFKIK